MGETVTDRQPADGAPTTLRDDGVGGDVARPVGVIGLEARGLAVVRALCAAGMRLLAWDPDPARAAAAGAAGAERAATASEIGRRCTIVLLILELGGDARVLHEALMATLAPGGLVVDMGASLPGPTRALAAELAGIGVRLVDAPIVDGAPGVVLMGGAAADLALAEPILAHLGSCVATGPVGSAQALAALLVELDMMPGLAEIRVLAGR